MLKAVNTPALKSFKNQVRIALESDDKSVRKAAR
jgi:hypothetical protein